MALARDQKKTDHTKRNRILSLVLTAALMVGALIIAFPPQDKINQGLDIQGGLSVVLSANPDDGQAVTAEDMEKAKSIIESRVNALGASEASVQIQGDDQILVQIPGMSDSVTALDTIGKTGVLEFARLDSFTDETVKNNIESGNIIDYTSVETPEGEMPTGALSGLTDYSDVAHIKVDGGTYTPLFTGDHIEQVTVGKESDTSQYYSVNLRLDPEATAAFATASTELLPTNGKVVILLDGEVNSAPAIQSAITTGEVSITGNYTLEEARALQTVLDSGSLPVSFEYEQSQTVGPTLGQGELSAGLMSMLLGIIIVMVYLLLFYKGFGLVPAANMIVFFVIYMGILGTLSAVGLFSLSLAGIAGIILSIGMTADSVILAIEKFKEELKEGKTVKHAASDGVRHAIITSVDADVVSLISALSLFFLATSSIKGFGLTLALGILCDILVMLIFVAPTIRLLAPKSIKYHPAFWGVAYAQELGDVRTGSHNYMLPEEASAKKEADKKKTEERRERKKSAKAAAKERERAADERAKKIKRDAAERAREEKRAEKAAKKERLEELKREDAEKDAARKQTRKDEKAARRAEKDAERAEEKLEVAEKAVKDAEKVFDAALDAETVADDNFASLVERVKQDKEREEEISSKTNEDIDTVVSETVDVEEVAQGAPRDETPRSAEEIADIISATAGSFVENTRVLVREDDEDTRESGPAEDQEYGVAEEMEELQGPAIHKNRAARRTEAKAKKSKK